MSLEFLFDNKLFDAKIKEVYDGAKKQLEAKDKLPKTHQPVEIIGEFTKVLIDAYRRADQKTIIKIRQMVDTNMQYILMMSHPYLVNRIMVGVMRDQAREKFKHEI